MADINEVGVEYIDYETLYPGILTKDGINIAPRTLTSQVINDEGKTLDEILEDIQSVNNTLIATSTEHVSVDYDGQKIFDIPTPIREYDIELFPPIVIAHNRVLQPTIEYMINTGRDPMQLILKDAMEPMKKGEIITFIFHYAKYIRPSDGFDADTLGGHKVTWEKPIDPMPGDVWIDLVHGIIQYWDGTQWVGFNLGGSIVNVQKATVTYTTRINTLNLPENLNYDPRSDILMLFENSVYIEKDKDYSYDVENNRILRIDGYWVATQKQPITFNFVLIKVTNGGKFLNETGAGNPEWQIGQTTNTTSDKVLIDIAGLGDNVKEALNILYKKVQELEEAKNLSTSTGVITNKVIEFTEDNWVELYEMDEEKGSVLTGYQLTINHELDTENILPFIYDANKKQQLMGLSIDDANNITLKNTSKINGEIQLYYCTDGSALGTNTYYINTADWIVDSTSQNKYVASITHNLHITQMLYNITNFSHQLITLGVDTSDPDIMTLSSIEAEQCIVTLFFAAN